MKVDFSATINDTILLEPIFLVDKYLFTYFAEEKMEAHLKIFANENMIADEGIVSLEKGDKLEYLFSMEVKYEKL
jgi:hypothetical protein